MTNSQTAPTSPRPAAAGESSATPTASGAGAGSLQTATVTPSLTTTPVANAATGEGASTSRSATRRSAIETVQPVSDLSPADAVRLVANTAVLARAANPDIHVISAKRNGVPGVFVWMPGWVWDGKTIVAAAETPSAAASVVVATSGKSKGRGKAAAAKVATGGNSEK